MDNLIELEVSDIKNSNVPSEAYALILTERNGNRMIPVIIGINEAKSIVLIINNFKSKRPSTHALLSQLISATQNRVSKVIIYHYEGGIYYSHIILKNELGEVIELDSRTSDAVAIALLTKAPIYIREETLNHLMVFSKTQKRTKPQEEEPTGTDTAQKSSSAGQNYELLQEPDNLETFIDSNLKDMTLNDLQDLLEGAVASEDFELAKIIHEEILRRENK